MRRESVGGVGVRDLGLGWGGGFWRLDKAGVRKERRETLGPPEGRVRGTGFGNRQAKRSGLSRSKKPGGMPKAYGGNVYGTPAIIKY